MSESRQWANLPGEIKKEIFCQVQDIAEDPIKARKALYHCQLVCKDWSLPAQAELYRNVFLPPDFDRIVKFASELEASAEHGNNRIIGDMRLGDLVKSVDFYPSIDSFSEAFKDIIFSRSVEKQLDIIESHMKDNNGDKKKVQRVYEE